MPKRKRDKQEPNIVVFLVEGESDQRALEIPLSDLIDIKHPEYQVLFLLQERPVDQSGDEVEDEEDEEKDDDEEDGELVEYNIYEYGGDITTSSFVRPDNIEFKITCRFILPAIKNEHIYPKKIAKIIQIVDLDGAYIPDDCIVPYSSEHQGREKVFYDSEKGLIETADASKLAFRNRRKRDNIDYLLSLPEKKIKIKSKMIPYEIYFFSSNLETFIANDANVESGKLRLADRFVRKYGVEREIFTKYFFEDERSIGRMGYDESWDFIRKDSNSVRRYTNIDCLIQRLLEEG